MSDKVIKEGHPDGLMTLFFSEMWERFCYYGMRTLLTLFLVKSLMKGDAEASLLYGAYTGLVYAAPILGGKMADKYLGYKYAVILGGLMMALGEFLILGGNQNFLLIGMGALIIGNGYFKANISTIVGKLYKDGDPKRDSGFTIFYIGINVGALLATTVVAYIGETYGFNYGFGLAGFGMLLGIFIFWSGRKKYGHAPGVDVQEAGKAKLIGPINYVQGITFGSFLLIPLCYLLILKNEVLNFVFLGLFIFVATTLIKAGIKEDQIQQTKIWKDRMIALVIFMVINIVFWACFEQAGTSLTLFADRNVDREIFGWLMPASMTQFFNPFFIITFGSIFSVMWLKLSKMGKNPNIPLKFSFGILQLGIGFLVTYIGFQFAEDNLVPILTLVILYMLHTTGELFLSPIGLSMVTKLSPKKMAGTAMGAWFLSFAIANLLGGQIATLTGGGHGGSSEEVVGFSASTTVEDAFILENKEDDYTNWNAFYEVPIEIEVDRKIKKEIEISKNITYSLYRDIQDWVLLREQLQKNASFSDWLENRGAIEELTSAGDWLNKEKWSDLKARYKSFIESDLNLGENAGISMKDWKYYRSGINDFPNKSMLLSEVLSEHSNKVQSDRLNNYIDVFTKIGIVLIIISILIALISSPLKKLMHGVE